MGGSILPCMKHIHMLSIQVSRFQFSDTFENDQNAVKVIQWTVSFSPIIIKFSLAWDTAKENSADQLFKTCWCFFVLVYLQSYIEVAISGSIAMDRLPPSGLELAFKHSIIKLLNHN